jgi:hypothetical protein
MVNTEDRFNHGAWEAYMLFGLTRTVQEDFGQLQHIQEKRHLRRRTFGASRIHGMGELRSWSWFRAVQYSILSTPRDFPV